MLVMLLTHVLDYQIIILVLVQVLGYHVKPGPGIGCTQVGFSHGPSLVGSSPGTGLGYRLANSIPGPDPDSSPRPGAGSSPGSGAGSR